MKGSFVGKRVEGRYLGRNDVVWYKGKMFPGRTHNLEAVKLHQSFAVRKMDRWARWFIKGSEVLASW